MLLIGLVIAGVLIVMAGQYIGFVVYQQRAGLRKAAEPNTQPAPAQFRGNAVNPYLKMLQQRPVAPTLKSGSGDYSNRHMVIRAGLIAPEVAHNDETGLYVQGQRRWLSVMSNSELPYYEYHLKRGQKATDDIGLLPLFKGTSVHDSWSPYWGYRQCQHALSNAHILRELTFVSEQLSQGWANRLIEHLLSLKVEVAQGQREDLSSLSDAKLDQGLERYRNLMAEGLGANPPGGGWPKNKRGRPRKTKARNLVERLQEHEREVLAFGYDFKVPFDNNQAERDLRMIKVQQKVSGGFRIELGASWFCRIRSYISTLRKQGQSAYYALKQAFKGQPLLPSLPPV